MRVQQKTSRKTKSPTEIANYERLGKWFSTFASLAHSPLPLDAYLQAVTDSLRTAADVDSAVIEWIDGDELVYCAASGAAARLIGTRLATTGSLSGLCVARQRALICRNTATDHRVDRVACEAVSAVSMVVAPVVHEGRSVAVLKLISREADHFGPTDVSILNAFCACVAVTIAREQVALENQQLLKDKAAVSADLNVESSLRIEYEKKLDDALRRRRTVLDNAHEAFISIDEGGYIVDWNEAATNLFGWRRREALGQELAQLVVPPHLRDAHRTGLIRYLATGEARMINRRVEVPAIRRDNVEFPAEMTISEVWFEGERQFACFLRDITDRRRATEADERLRLLINSVRDYAIFMLDTDGYIRSWNDGARSIKGYEAEEVTGRHFSMFYPPDDLVAGKPGEELRLAVENGRVEDEGWRVRKDGSVFWAHVILTALRDSAGQQQGFVKITRDMTSRRRLMELEASSRRMNQFLALLGHELRNPLAPIRNAVSILKLKASDDDEVIRSRQIVDRQLAHVTKLVDDLLEAGRITSGKIRLSTESVDLADVVQLSVEAINPLFEARSQRLVVQSDDAPLYLNGDLTRLVQALSNLLNNASKFSPVASTIRLQTGTSDGFVFLRVADEGRGIGQAALGSIFDLFVQEHPPGAHLDEGGLGIGLTLVRAIVELHGGRVEARSAGEGRGSAFSIWLPRAPMPSGQFVERVVKELSGQAELDVLVVDDNRDSADSMTLLVSLLGHRVRAAYDGASALRLFGERRPDVVLLDLSMPGLTGFDVIARMRSGDGEASIIAAMTGLGSDEDKARTGAAGFDAHLTKPVELSELEVVFSIAGQRAQR